MWDRVVELAHAVDWARKRHQQLPDVLIERLPDRLLDIEDNEDSDLRYNLSNDFDNMIRDAEEGSFDVQSQQ